ncbi:MAG TPA: hypothetical protein VHE99_02080 [Gammaproteobacteria bacterium]|nr:hypothetical protein [Gammaproteobacteria bacterium]
MRNLLDERDILELYQSGILPAASSAEDAISTLEIFPYLNIAPEILNLDENGYISLNEHGLQRKILVNEIFLFAKKLNFLKECKGFQTLSNSINNQTQFFDTIFEVDCAHFMLTNYNITKIDLSAEIIVNDRIKRPDFSFLTKNGAEVFCECKSLESAHRIKNSKVIRLMQQLEPHLKNLATEKFRIEIAFKTLPTHWNANYSEQLASSIQVLIENQFTKNHLDLVIDDMHETHVKLCLVNEKPYFNCLINLGNKAPDKSPTFVIGEIANVQKDIKNSIKDAMTQLPSDKPGIIFINSLNESDARQAIIKFFRYNTKDNIYGVFSKTKTFQCHINPNSNLQIDLAISPPALSLLNNTSAPRLPLSSL